jgi:hypothetical protein
METSDQDISAGKSGPIEESDEEHTGQSGDQDISAGKSGETLHPDESESSEDDD